MRLKQYLQEAEVQAGIDSINFIADRGDFTNTKIPDDPNVVLAGDAPRPKKTVMIYRDRRGDIKTEDNKGNKETFKLVSDLVRYLNEKGFVYFEGYNRF